MSDPIFLHSQLIEQAKNLANNEPKRPKQASLRRAVSSTYYALFHFLIHEATQRIVGTQNNKRLMRNLVARAFDHAEMKTAAKQFEQGEGHFANTQKLAHLQAFFTVPMLPSIKKIANLFIEAQEARHRADYDLSADFRRRDVLLLLRKVETAIKTWPPKKKLSPEELVQREFFLLSLLFWKGITR